MENEDQHENENEKEKENQKNIDLKKDEESTKEKLKDDSNLKEEKKIEVLDNKDKDKEKVNEDNNINEFDLTQQQKNYDKGKIIEITDDMIFAGTKFEDYDEIIELDLSKKNIASFMNNRNVPFEEFTELQKLNLSYNWMTFTYDIRFFTKLKELYLNDNKIDDLSFAESLPNLEILNAENNEISYITCLNKCLNLKILKLSQNKIEFLNSTLNTIKNLRKLEELTIKDNPFLTQLFGYKQYFIYNYQNILKLDEEEILDLDRDIAGRFVRENNIIYNNSTKRPMSSRPGVKSQSITKNINNIK
jgi:Leucine-rich repeat (LRR) protein